MGRISVRDGGRRLRRADPDVVQALARAASLTSAPSSVTLGAFAEAAVGAGRSLNRLAKVTGATRQAVARWTSGGPVRKRSQRARLAAYAARLSAENGPPVGASPPTRGPRHPGRVSRDLATLARLTDALGWGGPVLLEGDGSVQPPVLLAPAWALSPADVVARASKLAGFELVVRPGLGRSSGDLAMWRRVTCRVLSALGVGVVRIARELGVDHTSVLWHLQSRDRGIA